MFTVQRNQHNHIIVCEGTMPKNNYFVVFTGTFFRCNQIANGAE
jgi:hypothetical protein